MSFTIKTPDGLRADQFVYAPNYITNKKRILFMRGPILNIMMRNDLYSAMSIQDDLIAMNLEDPDKPIYLIIDSNGGDVNVGFALYDMIKASKAPVTTVGLSCASMATVLLVAGKRRLVFPHSRNMLHLPETGFQGTVEDAKIRTKLLGEITDEIADCYVESGVTAGLTGGTPTEIKKRILKDINREMWIDAKKSIEYGLVDGYITAEELFSE